MRIGLIGATGMIGSRVAAEARARGHQILGATRSGTGDTRVVDVNDAAAVAGLAAGQDAVVLAVRTATPGGEPLLAVGLPVLDGLRKASVSRLVVVGGAGSLEASPGVRIMDTVEIPEVYRREVLAQAELLEFLRADAQDLDWTYISPPAEIEPGVRTGTFRTGGDRLLVDAQGNSRISAEDYAAALVDELEQRANVRRRITVGY